MTTRKHTSTRALIFLDDREEDAFALRRLALFFDEVLVVMPEWRGITISGSGRNPFIEVTPGQIEVRDFDYFKDCVIVNVSAENLSNRVLRETLEVFLAKGIARQVDPRSSPAVEDAPAFEDFVEALMSLDAEDEHLCELTGTTPDDFTLRSIMPKGPAEAYVFRTHQGEEFKLFEIQHPPVLADSRFLTTTLYAAAQESASPVIVDPSFAPQLSYRYERFLKALQIAAQRSPRSVRLPSHSMSLGSVAFAVSNEILKSAWIEQASPEQIVRFRESTEEARRQYVSVHLSELSELTEADPWSRRVEAEVQRYVRTKLTSHLVLFDAGTREIYQKLFGRLTVNAAELLRSSYVGSVTGDIVGNVVPGASPLALLAAGMLLGTAKETPKFVQTLVEFLLDRRTHLRSSIAYVAALDRR